MKKGEFERVQTSALLSNNSNPGQLVRKVSVIVWSILEHFENVLSKPSILLTTNPVAFPGQMEHMQYLLQHVLGQL